MRFILSGIFGGLLAICGVSISEDTVQTMVLLVFFCVSMELVRIQAVKS